MLKLKRKEAFDRAVALFGPWGSWGRAEHVAYGLIRGCEYARMERCANDAPPMLNITRNLGYLGAWADWAPAKGTFALPPPAVDADVSALVEWVRKTPRPKRQAPEAAE